MAYKPVPVNSALGLLTTLLLALGGTVSAQEFNGLLVYSHEVHTLQPCGEAHTFWVRAPEVGHELAAAYRHLATRSYEPVYAELEGNFDKQPAGEFSTNYNGTMTIHAIRSVSREQVAACRDGNL